MYRADLSAVLTAQSAEPLVYVVVLNYNSWELSEACLRSLHGERTARRRVLFVDNASTDGSPDKIRKMFPDIEVLENEANLFFAGGNNRGIEYALEHNADYVFVLNNDTVVEQGCIESLVRFMESNPSAGACQPALLAMCDPSVVASAGCELNLVGRAWDRLCGARRSALETEPTEILAASGGALFLRAHAIAEADGFNHRYIMYFEDVDLGIRLRRAGHSVFFVPGPGVLHHVSATTKLFGDTLRVELCERNSYRLMLAHYPLHWMMAGLACGAALSAAVAIRRLVSGDAEGFRRILTTLLRAFGSIPQEMKSRASADHADRSWWKMVSRTMLFPPSV